MADVAVTLTEFSRGLSGFLNQVQYRGQSFSIRRGKNVVARVSPAGVAEGFPIGQLDEFLASGPRLDPAERQAMVDDMRSLRAVPATADDPWAS